MTADGRFAPSPTGTLHVGNLRTAVLAWLFARKQDARFLVRMEDLDHGRVQAGAAERQLHDLRAIGLEWDGEVVAQSHRHHAYEDAIAQLLATGDLYECFCTRAEIREASSAPHGELPEGAYPGTCRELSEAERRERRRSARPPALRVRAGWARVAFSDRLAGPREGLVDDFVVRRNDGAHGYNLAVALDDADQSIGEVVRGSDLIDSTPRQIWVSERLGLDGPSSWAHVPLVLGADGARLAKRHGAVTLADRAAAGESPAETLALLGRSLGLCRPDEGAVSPAQLLERFDPRALPREDGPLPGPGSDATASQPAS